MPTVLIRKIGTLLYDNNTINRDGVFYVKPSYRGTWSSLGYAKGHISQIFNDKCCKFPAVLECYMDAEFVVMSDDYEFLETVPVKDFFVGKMIDFVKNGLKNTWYESKKNRELTQKYLTSLGIDVIMVTEAQKRATELEKQEKEELARLKAKYEKV